MKKCWPAGDVNDGGHVAAERFSGRLGSLSEDERLEDLSRGQGADETSKVGKSHAGKVTPEEILTAAEFVLVVPRRRFVRNGSHVHRHFLTLKDENLRSAFFISFESQQ